MYSTGHPAVDNDHELFRINDYGRSWFRTGTPSHHPILSEGPIARLLEATATPYRPAHIAFIAGG